jgi:nitrite reductase/ring-hydroxylating ferredoxin subunit
MSDQDSLNLSSLKQRLARVPASDIEEGGAISLDVSFQAGRQSVIVLRHGDQLRAFLNHCPHAGWPLERFDGRFLFTPDGDLICAAHGAVFDARTGACLAGPGTGTGLTRVEVVWNGEDWLIG